MKRVLPPLSFWFAASASAAVAAVVEVEAVVAAIPTAASVPAPEAGPEADLDAATAGIVSFRQQMQAAPPQLQRQKCAASPMR